METYAEMMKGSVNGVVVIAGDLGNSELIKRIKGISHPRMPMNGPPYLSDLEVELISSWVESGAILK